MASVSIVIPAYNEAKRLPSTLNKIKSFLSSKKLKYEIIVVNDGSSDETAKAAISVKGLKVTLISNKKNMGKGYCVNRGVKKAKNDIILFTDADLSTPVKFLSPFLKLHSKGNDVVAASRALNRKLVKKRQPIHRDMMGRIFNVFVRLITGLKIKDTQCGFKSFKKSAAKKIFSKQTIFDFGFDVEILYIASLHGFKIAESPVEWYDSPATKVNPLMDSLRMFGGLFAIRLKSIKGIYR